MVEAVCITTDGIVISITLKAEDVYTTFNEEVVEVMKIVLV